MKKFFLIFIILTSLIITSCDNSAMKTQNEKDASIINIPSDFELKDLEGNTVSLSSLRGKKVVLTFWALWCHFCVEELPEFEKLYQAHKDNNLVIVAVNIKDPVKKVADFVSFKKLTFPFLLDSDGKVASKYAANSIPLTLFLNEKGEILYRRVGAMDYEMMESFYKSLYIEQGE